MLNFLEQDSKHHKEFKYLWERLQEWGESRNITTQATSKDQYLKLITEYDEYICAKGDSELEDDALCDMIVVCIMIAIIEVIDLQDFSRCYISPAQGMITKDASIEAISYHIRKLAESLLKKNRRNTIVNLHAIISAIDILYETSVYRGDILLVDVLDLVVTELEGRYGTFFNGAFVKSTDPDYDGIVTSVTAVQTLSKD